MNILIMIICVLLYGMNHIMKPWYNNEIISLFMNGYFNDILAGLFLISFTNVLLYKVNKSIHKLVHIEIYLLIVGIFWEYITPLYKTNSTSDPIDILAYMLGGFVYWSIIKNIKITKIKNVKKLKMSSKKP